jgi:hypothetical protein
VLESIAMDTNYIAGVLDTTARIQRKDGRIRFHGRADIIDALVQTLKLRGHRESPTRFVVARPDDRRRLLQTWQLGSIYCDDEIDAALDKLAAED